MRGWDANAIAAAAGAHLHAGSSGDGPEPGPRRASIDSRETAPGELFVGLRGERADGGEYAPVALRAGAWGVLVAPEHARAAASGAGGGVVLSHPDPLAGMHSLARAWQRQLRAGGTRVVAITGSTGKTSTKDILAALLAPQVRVVASPENLNTEIGLPLTVLAAPSDTEVLVLEMAMRGAGQIAELTAIAEPDVGVIVNVGPVHLELLGTVQAIAGAKAELIAGLAPGATIVVPAGEELLRAHLRSEVSTITFGAGGDVSLGHAAGDQVRIRCAGETLTLRPSFAQAHNLENLLAAVAVCRALGIIPHEQLEVRFSALRGERVELSGGVVLINDCYNANPMSMRAAIDDLSDTAPARRVALLGDMLELGPEAARLHREIGEHAAARGIELLLSVGPLAAEMRSAFTGESHSVADAPAAAELLRALLREGDTVLVKGSRGVGLERVAELLAGAPSARREEDREAHTSALAAGSRRR